MQVDSGVSCKTLPTTEHSRNDGFITVTLFSIMCCYWRMIKTIWTTWRWQRYFTFNIVYVNHHFTVQSQRIHGNILLQESKQLLQYNKIKLRIPAHRNCVRWINDFVGKLTNKTADPFDGLEPFTAMPSARAFSFAERQKRPWEPNCCLSLKANETPSADPYFSTGIGQRVFLEDSESLQNSWCQCLL